MKIEDEDWYAYGHEIMRVEERQIDDKTTHISSSRIATFHNEEGHDAANMTTLQRVALAAAAPDMFAALHDMVEDMRILGITGSRYDNAVLALEKATTVTLDVRGIEIKGVVSV
jgi:hypothetical protein